MADCGDNTPFESRLRRMWQKNVYNLPVCKDFPRLVRRLTIYSSTSGTAPEYSNDPESSLLESMVAALRALVLKLENGEQADEIINKIAEIASCSTSNSSLDALDCQETMRKFVAAIGEDSKTVRLLKTIHQSVVLESMLALKDVVTGDILTKDVRGPEGWKVEVSLADYIQVTHTRREQSLDQFGDTANHFEFSWEVRQTFDVEMEDLTGTSVRITDLETGPEMSAASAMTLRQKLVGGNLIVM